MISVQSLHQLSVSPEHAPNACHSPPEATAQKSFEVLLHLQPLLWTHCPALDQDMLEHVQLKGG